MQVLVIAVLLKIIMKRRFSIIQVSSICIFSCFEQFGDVKVGNLLDHFFWGLCCTIT